MCLLVDWMKILILKKKWVFFVVFFEDFFKIEKKSPKFHWVSAPENTQKKIAAYILSSVRVLHLSSESSYEVLHSINKIIKPFYTNRISHKI